MVVRLLFFAALYFAPQYAISEGNCTKTEILDLAKSGFSRDDIGKLCNEMTDNPNCCCAEVYNVGDSPITRGEIDYQIKTGGRVYFLWQDAAICGLRSHGLCVEQRYCGMN